MGAAVALLPRGAALGGAAFDAGFTARDAGGRLALAPFAPAFLAGAFPTAGFFAAARFAGALRATVFLAAGFFAATRLDAAFFDVACFAADFFAGVFFTGAFFAAAFFAPARLAAAFFATVRLPVAFLAGAFFVAAFFVALFRAGAFLAAGAFRAGARLADAFRADGRLDFTAAFVTFFFSATRCFPTLFFFPAPVFDFPVAWARFGVGFFAVARAGRLDAARVFVAVAFFGIRSSA